MDFTALNPFRSTFHQLGERMLTLSRESGELYAAQAKLVEKQTVQSLETWRGLVMAQQQSAQAMGKVYLDTLNIELPKAEKSAAA